MPFVYSAGLNGTTVTTSGTPNTEVDDLFIKSGSGRCAAILALYIHGKGAGLTAISGITQRIKKWTTASTSGTSTTPQPRDIGAQAAKFTTAYSPTAGSGGGLYHLSIGCGAAGPGGWVAPNPDAMLLLEAGYAGSFDAYSASGTASLVHELSMEVVE